MCSVSHQLATDARRFALDVAQIQELGQKAIEAKARAHCPYSNFHVGAALLTSSGGYITGVNVENASYPVGSDGEKVFKAVAVATDISPPASPCGSCRQFMREFCGLEMPIFMYDVKGDYVVMTLGELLPMSFGPDHLKPDGSTTA
ncbi:hypothetical protein MMC15_000804 [Xylographa vitiligo]|nr:hypothetical protein [Xylographa vitiligo]